MSDVKRHEFSHPKECPDCGYSTKNRGGWSVHQKTCRRRPIQVDGEKSQLRERVLSLEQQLLTKDDHYQRELQAKDDHYQRELQAKDEHYQRELQAKDRQIEELMKRPRTVTHNDNRTTNNQRYVVEQNVNVFGCESIDHISDEQLQRLLREPTTAVARLVQLKLSVPENKNVRVPNKRERVVEVVTLEAGQKKWKTMDRDGVLERMWDDNGLLLENEADEDDNGVGARFVRHQERVKASQDQNGKMYREQLQQIHTTLADATRT